MGEKKQAWLASCTGPAWLKSRTRLGGWSTHTYTRTHTVTHTQTHIHGEYTARERERRKEKCKKKKKREEGARFLLQTPPINGEAPPSCCSEQRRGRCGQFHREMTLCAKSTVGYTSNLSPIVMFSKECFRPLLKCRPFPYQKCHWILFAWNFACGTLFFSLLCSCVHVLLREEGGLSNTEMVLRLMRIVFKRPTKY